VLRNAVTPLLFHRKLGLVAVVFGVCHVDFHLPSHHQVIHLAILSHVYDQLTFYEFL
jgi:hypothetical protein